MNVVMWPDAMCIELDGRDGCDTGIHTCEVISSPRLHDFLRPHLEVGFGWHRSGCEWHRARFTTPVRGGGDCFWGNRVNEVNTAISCANGVLDLTKGPRGKVWSTSYPGSGEVQDSEKRREHEIIRSLLAASGHV